MSEIGSFSLTILLKKTACAGLFLTALYGCAIGNPVRGYVEATAWSANYSEEYIPDFQLQTADGVPLYLGGIQVKKFSNGGVGGSECCTPIPGVGSTIRVVWTAGDKGDR
jgi:hypothetical protein